jgi:hypothetical protein
MISGDKKEFLANMLKEREPIFSEADIKIKSDLEAYHLVEIIIKRLEEYISKNK